MVELTGIPGFTPPPAEKTRRRSQAVALELIATAALTASLVVAATAVSLGKKSLSHGELAQRPTLQLPAGQP